MNIYSTTLDLTTTLQHIPSYNSSLSGRCLIHSAHTNVSITMNNHAHISNGHLHKTIDCFALVRIMWRSHFWVIHFVMGYDENLVMVLLRHHLICLIEILVYPLPFKVNFQFSSLHILGLQPSSASTLELIESSTRPTMNKTTSKSLESVF